MPIVICAAFLATASFGQDSLANVPCSGSYTLHFGTGVGTAQGKSMPVGTAGSQPAIVEMSQCGRRMDIVIGGKSVTLSQEVLDGASYSGRLHMGDGVTRNLSLTRGGDRNLRGALIASGQGVAVARPIWLMANALRETRFEDCFGTEEELAPSRGLSASEANVTRLFSERGTGPSEGFEFSDYMRDVSTRRSDRATRDAQTMLAGNSVLLYLNASGEIVPRSDVAVAQHDREQAICSDQDYLDAPRFVLEFDIIPIDPLINDDVDVFVKVIDIETSKIMESRRGVPDAAAANLELSAMRNAMSKLQWPVGRMKGAYVRD